MQHVRHIFHIVNSIGCFILGVLGILQSPSVEDSIALYTTSELISLALVWFGIRFIWDREKRNENCGKYRRMPGWTRLMTTAPSLAQAWGSLIYGVMLLGVNVTMEFRGVAESHFEWL